MTKVKSLYKLSRNRMFVKNYYCIYCDMIDFDEGYLQEHVKNYHDEFGKIIKTFRCNKCAESIVKWEIIRHMVECNQV